MINLFKRFDIFSQPIQFNSIEQTSKKKTITGALLSVVVLFTSLSYFIYESNLYFGNKINPIFRSQAFVRNDLISVDLKEEIIAFKFFKYMMITDQQYFDPNKTYISYIALFQYQTATELETVLLDITKCKNPLLKGYLCIDFTNLKNKKLEYDVNNSIISSIMLYSYRCTDTDWLKTFVPDNCAQPEEIDAYISQRNYIISHKIQQQQFNTTSKQMNLNYKNQFTPINLSQLSISEFKIQLQETEVIDGSFIQQTQSFSSPVSFSINQFTMDYQTSSLMKNSKYFFVAVFQIDEQVHFTEIKYPTFPEVLAICNSTFALLMCLGYIARKFSFSLFKDQMLLMYMQNIFQGSYLSILQQNKIVEFNSIDLCQQDESDDQSDEQLNSINIPTLNVKQSGKIMNSNNKIDFILETDCETKQKDIYLTESISIIERQSINQAEINYKQNQSEIKNFNCSKNQNQTEINEINQTEHQPLSKNSNFSFSHANSSVSNKIKISQTQRKSQQKSKDSSPIAQSQQLKLSKKKKLFDNLSEKQRAYSNQHFTKQIENLLFKFKQVFLIQLKRVESQRALFISVCLYLIQLNKILQKFTNQFIHHLNNQ